MSIQLCCLCRMIFIICLSFTLANTSSFEILSTQLIMATICNKSGHYIFVLGFLLSSSILSSFFLVYSQLSPIGCLPYFHTWCGLSANLGCRSEKCCTRLAENTGRKKSPSWHHRTILSDCVFATKACIDNRKKTC